MSAGLSKSLYRASDTDDYEVCVARSCMRQCSELCGRFLLNHQNGQTETRWEFMMFVTLQTANKATFSGSQKSCISQMLRALRAGWINNKKKTKNALITHAINLEHFHRNVVNMSWYHPSFFLIYCCQHFAPTHFPHLTRIHTDIITTSSGPRFRGLKVVV